FTPLSTQHAVDEAPFSPAELESFANSSNESQYRAQPLPGESREVVDLRFQSNQNQPNDGAWQCNSAFQNSSNSDSNQMTSNRFNIPRPVPNPLPPPLF